MATPTMTPTQPVRTGASAGGVGPAPAPKGAGSRRWRVGTVLPPIVLALALLAIWQLYVSASGIDPTVLPGPIRVAVQGFDNRSDLWANTVPTVIETLLGFALSMTVAWLLAIVCDFSSLCRRAVEPLLVVSQTIPIVAIAPLFVIWFGFNTLPKVLIVALVTFFPVTVSLLQGFRTTPVEADNLLRSMGATRWQRFVRLRVPTALPFFFSGLRISITFAVVGAIFGEYVGAVKGLGIYMEISKNARRTDLVLAAVVVTATASLVLYFLVVLIERLVIPWSQPALRRRGRR